MHIQTIRRLIGLLFISCSLLGAQTYAICSGATLNGIQDIHGCANYEGCGSYTELPPVVQYSQCATWCCPGDPTVYFDPISCDSGPTTPVNGLGEPYCCDSLSDQGKMWAQYACASE